MATTATDRTDIEQRFHAAMDTIQGVLLDTMDDAAYDDVTVHLDGIRSAMCRALGGHDMAGSQCGRPEHAACVTCGEPAATAA